MEMHDSWTENETLVDLFYEFEKAIIENNEEKINKILQNPDIGRIFTYDDDLSILHVATEHGTINLVKLLFQQEGIDINVKNETGATPIFNAIKNSLEMTKLYLNYNATVNVVCKNGLTPLHHALFHGNLNTVCLLLEKLINGIVFFDETVVENSEENQKKSSDSKNESSGKESEEKLREKEEGLNERNGKKEENRNEEKNQDDLKEAEKLERVVKILLEHKKELGLNENDYPLFIYFAAQLEIPDICQLILNDMKKTITNYDSTLNYFDQKGDNDRAALHYAVRKGNKKIVNFLLRQGANPNSKTKMDFTPLHYAVALENLEICRLLLANGADVNAESTYEGSPLFTVAGRSELQNLLKSSDTYYYDEKYKCVMYGLITIYEPNLTCNTEIMELLLKYGANPECHSKHGMTPLLEACRDGRLEDVKILLNYNANHNAKDLKKNSALHHAVLSCSREIITLLVDEKQLNINLRNEKRYTPLMCLVENSEHTCLENIEYLIQRGANINARNVHGLTSLHIATHFDFIKIVNCLIDYGANWKINTKCKNYLPIVISVNPTLYDFQLSSSRKLIISLVALKNSKVPIDNYFECYMGNEEKTQQDARNYFEESKKEMKILKETAIINEKTVSYYDFLTKKYYTCYKYVKNSKIRETLTKGDYKNTFPCYAALIEGRFERVKKLEDVIDKSVEFLMKNEDKIPMPIAAVDKIMRKHKLIDFYKSQRFLERKQF